MTKPIRKSFIVQTLPKAGIAVACAGLLAAGCASVNVSGGSSGGGVQTPGGGVQLPGGGSSGGGSSGGSTGGGMPGGSSGGGSSGGGSTGGGMPDGGMDGGSSGGGATGGSSGGGMSGGSMGGAGGMEGVEIPSDGSGSATSGDCSDGGVTGGGIGGTMGCESGSGGQAGGVGEFPGETDAERAERLGKELDESVGDFDEVLMEEQREISSAGRSTEGFDTGASGRSGGTISLGEQAAGAMGQGGGGGGGGAGNDPVGSNSPNPVGGMSAEEVAKRTPDDIEVIIDDDIVAKQLREAALAEEDPELRERLWEEYRKYKGMSQ